MNVPVPEYLQRWVRSEAGLAGLKMPEYVARALYHQVLNDRAARERPDHDETARVEQARAEAARALES